MDYHWRGLSLSDFGIYLSVGEAARRPIKDPHQPPLGDFVLAKSERPATTGALKDQEKRALVAHARCNRRGCMVSSRAPSDGARADRADAGEVPGHRR
jgi:hypothetical protein